MDNDIFSHFPDRETFDRYWNENYVPVTYEDVATVFRDFVKSAEGHIYLSDYEEKGCISKEDFKDNLSQEAQFAFPMAKPIALAADHGGFELKEAVKAHLDELGLEYIDFGTHSTASVDYPDMALPACDAVVSGQCSKALLFCGTGVGISMAANKVKGIRACCCSDSFSCEYTRRHNDANALCMGGRVVGPGLACQLVDLFLNTPFEGGRHANRIAKLMAIENR